MKLAKNHIDIGVWTNNLDDMLPFWRDTVPLPYTELLKLGGGVHQHRLALKGSVFKLNHVREPLPDIDAAGYRELMIVSDVTAPETLTDSDGNLVTLVPEGYRDLQHIGMRMAVSSPDQSMTFFTEALGAEALSENHCRWASTIFMFEKDPEVSVPETLQARGYRYITVQVYKVDTEHARLLKMGATEGSPPRTLGSTARISFIRDPDGNAIEVSQRASLTGDLTPG